ncbi:UNVERIFIED_CONTAM: oxo-acid lyase [Clostridioides difficile]|uniref:2-dehydro-3-deoxy-phosphogluconate aldolase n=1 Tax=Clostridioides difficile TaxID=1496 RepID=UPI00038CFD5C|nr:KDGP aldolase family protein [Clostridioides difficile]EQE82719.1 2-dehydro-3-deoxyphosphogluconate aldolase [Clostridioides difficile CD69]MBY1884967.1 KDGP aldolase family protein [Clostridioides difficile]MBZ0780884.1 KDGP aldolase family protein [Clostridioides difficile]MBZ0854358.1 KDGP aldolase family protein [Clostridioides difficile]MCG7701218.1 KDGP aldolase family protein [Clostridioides difficile]
MSCIPQYYKNRVCLNVLAGSIKNAKEVYNACDGHVLIGVLSKNYSTVEAAIEDMKKYSKEIDNAISVGLGAGDPNQSNMVSQISKELQPQHINQVFTGVATSRALLGQNDSIINGLVSPTGKPGFVKISTGPLSSKEKDGMVPIETAIAMMKDMGGLKTKDEYIEVAKVCAKQNFYLAPTGGIDLDNFKEIVQIALDAGVEKVIPHVYTSIIDKETGDTKVEDIEVLYKIMKELLG